MEERPDSALSAHRAEREDVGHGHGRVEAREERAAPRGRVAEQRVAQGGGVAEAQARADVEGKRPPPVREVGLEPAPEGRAVVDEARYSPSSTPWVLPTTFMKSTRSADTTWMGSSSRGS